MSNIKESSNDTRIKLYPDGMDLTSMLYGTEEQAREASFFPEYAKELFTTDRDGANFVREKRQFYPAQSFYWYPEYSNILIPFFYTSRT
jgi:hypothetical protein